MPKGPRSPQLIWMGILFFLALSYPFLGIANRPFFWKGIPILYVYVFGVWIFTVLVIAFLSRKNNS